MNIRKATVRDVPAIHALGEHVSEFNVNDQTVTFWPAALLEHAVQSDDVVILVAEAEDAIVGFLIINYSKGLKKALIENIYVQPDRRGQGIAHDMLEHMFQLLPDMDCEFVSTLVRPDAQSAIDLYSRSGFTHGETFLWMDASLSDLFKKRA
ncbi:MAG TPA: GNAT family N-acetyltransferase [Candidatus Saccharimonadales bacterium]|nr:GNAT family N-acetyltransferase [Candidatus Saccharimonadales bacterium]